MAAMNPDALTALLSRLRAANAASARDFPGEPADRQPVHVVYGGAHLFKADTARKAGALALKALDEHLPDAASFGAALGLGADPARVRARVVHKLQTEPVEDFRIDFEDGYGHRTDAEEDGHAGQAAAELAAGLAAGTLPPFTGLRVKALTDESAPRASRTLDLFLGALLARTGGRLPAGFRVTLPKVEGAAQVALFAELLALAEGAHGLAPGALRLELMIETAQAIIDAEGRVPLPAMVRAAGGRCVGAHFGTYDYTASVGVTAACQTADHPAADLARHLMRASLGPMGVPLSDGAVTLLPVARHRAPKDGALTPAQEAENRAAILAAWRLHHDQVRRSLANGWTQGWDLHPAQLVSRYAAIFGFFLEGLEAATARLRNFTARAAQASLHGEVFDDAATGQGLLNFFLRGLACGALTEAEALASGLTLDELRSRSFAKIVAGRRAKG